jgi:cellulose synthase/poly-beta-1,6-N-acetylglucosamine synthase-like glycosyltransferase
MDTSYVLLLTAAFTMMFFLIQRTERQKRVIVILISLVAFELIRRFIWYRDIHHEAWLALFIALLLNFLFWLFIGRYNPVGTSDDIQVLGMDD